MPEPHRVTRRQALTSLALAAGSATAAATARAQSPAASPPAAPRAAASAPAAGYRRPVQHPAIRRARQGTGLRSRVGILRPGLRRRSHRAVEPRGVSAAAPRKPRDGRRRDDRHLHDAARPGAPASDPARAGRGAHARASGGRSGHRPRRERRVGDHGAQHECQLRRRSGGRRGDAAALVSALRQPRPRDREGLDSTGGDAPAARRCASPWISR